MVEYLLFLFPYPIELVASFMIMLDNVIAFLEDIEICFLTFLEDIEMCFLTARPGAITCSE